MTEWNYKWLSIPHPEEIPDCIYSVPNTHQLRHSKVFCHSSSHQHLTAILWERDWHPQGTEEETDSKTSADSSKAMQVATDWTGMNPQTLLTTKPVFFFFITIHSEPGVCHGDSMTHFCLNSWPQPNAQMLVFHKIQKTFPGLRPRHSLNK